MQWVAGLANPAVSCARPTGRARIETLDHLRELVYRLALRPSYGGC